MNRITPNQYIRLNKKICNSQIILMVDTMAGEWGITPVDACYRILTEAVMKEVNKRKTDSLRNH